MKKIVIAGAGGRGYTHINGFMNEMPEKLRLAGVFDINPIRAEYMASKFGGKVYDDFEAMLENEKPDFVLIATIDSTHHTYVVKALEAGYDVLLEKPMTIDKEKCLEILEAERRTGKKVTVTFNCRFMPFFSAIKEFIMTGALGEIQHVDLKWMLDRSHGADYFRRWHRYIEKSGGLLVHKATHHFDVVNWLISDSPSKVSAFASRRFYGPTREQRGERCISCKYKESCEFYRDFSGDKFLWELYFEAEQADGYFRDRCVFADDINIYDNMAVNVWYKTGTTLSYSLVAYSPYEGWNLTINGTDGRLEAKTSPDSDQYEHIFFYAPNGNISEINVKKLTGDHGGSDAIMRKSLICGFTDGDKLGRNATSLDGAKSLLIGACANESIKTGKIIDLDEIIKDYV